MRDYSDKSFLLRYQQEARRALIREELRFFGSMAGAFVSAAFLLAFGYVLTVLVFCL